MPCAPASLGITVKVVEKDTTVQNAEKISITLTPDMLRAIRTRVRRSLDDPRASVPLDEAFDRIEKLHADTVKARKDASLRVVLREEAIADLTDIYTYIA